MVGALYRTLVEDITKRANDTTECMCLSDVFAHKYLSRKDFEAAFTAAETRRGILDCEIAPNRDPTRNWMYAVDYLYLDIFSGVVVGRET